MEHGKIYYALQDGVYVLKFTGNIFYGEQWGFNLCKALYAFIERTFAEEQFENFLIDLTETTYIDSTHMGLLAQIAKLMHLRSARKPAVISTNPSITRTLETMGFQAIFEIVRNPADLAGVNQELPPAEVDLRRVLLNAHKSLSDVNPENAAEFKDVIAALERSSNGGS